MTNAELARRFLAALEAGEDARGLRAELATAADRAGEDLIRRGEDLVERAREVQAGGPHAWREAIALAEQLASEAAPAVDDEDAAAEGGE